MNRKVPQLKRNMFILAGMFIILFLCDRFTKMAASDNLRLSGEKKIINGILSFRYLENTGAAFGILKDSRWFFIILSGIIFIVLLWIIGLLYIRIKKDYENNIHDGKSAESSQVYNYKSLIFLQYLLGILACGALGNLVDRLVYGYVIDFIKFDFINFPIFNLADVYVTVSIFFILIYIIFFYRENKTKMNHLQ